MPCSGVRDGCQKPERFFDCPRENAPRFCVRTDVGIVLEPASKNVIEQWPFFGGHGSNTNGSNTKTIPKTLLSQWLKTVVTW